jgi:hypothetical protein
VGVPTCTSFTLHLEIFKGEEMVGSKMQSFGRCSQDSSWSFTALAFQWKLQRIISQPTETLEAIRVGMVGRRQGKRRAEARKVKNQPDIGILAVAREGAR